MKEAVILVPGIMGSVLQDGPNVIWPGSPLELIFPYRHMASLMKPDLQVTDVIRNVSICSQYDHLISALGTCGFSERAQPATLKVYPYDWRKDNTFAAQGLADCVDAMAGTLGANAEINIVAHSMGGLISRYYLESGDFSARRGFKHVKRLITLGTPHLGSPIALSAALGEEKRAFLNADQVKQIANDRNFPALYQLLPPRGEPFAWNRANDARFEPVDIYASGTANKLGLETANLASAERFHAKLKLSHRPAHVRYFFFAGTRQQTTSSMQITFPQAGGARAQKVDRDDAGDGTVPTWSGSLSGIQMEPVGGEHGELYKNGELKRILGALLGKPGVLLAAGDIPEISVLHKVIEPGHQTRVTIDFPQDTVKVTGELQLRQRTDSAGNVLRKPQVTTKFPVAYSGAPIDHLAILIDVPHFPGIYELGYFPKRSGTRSSVAATEIIVQGV